MRRTFRRSSFLLVALTLVASLALPGVALAQADPAVGVSVAPTGPLEFREAYELGRFRDRSDWGDYSSLLTQALAILALARTPDAPPSPASVGLLLAQQCDDGGFPDAFRPPSTQGPVPCDSAVDTTAYVVQALDAVEEHEAVARAVEWLTDVQSPDGSFGAADGTNTNSTGLAAVALAIGGQEAAAAAAREWVWTQQDGCGATSPGAIPFNADERGVEVVSTAQVLQGLTGASLGTVSAQDAAPTIPDSPCVGPDDQIDPGNGIEAAAAWLASVLTDEPAVDTGFGPSEGATADALLGFASAGVGGETIDAMADWLETRVGPYTQGQGFDATDAAYAGATAKLLLTMDVAGRDPRHTDGTDLVVQLLGRQITELDPVEVSCDVPDAGATPGRTVPCALTGLIPLETVHVRAASNPVFFDEHVAADGTGAAAFDLVLPDGVDGDATVTLTVDGIGAPALATTAFAIDLTTGPDDEDDPDPTPGDQNDETPGDQDGERPGNDEGVGGDDGMQEDEEEAAHAGGDDASTEDEAADVVDSTTTPVDTPTPGGSGRGALPETGADTGVLASMAAATIALGLLAIALTRRIGARR